ncbi:MAG: dephospho-CoA kinase [Verrucomicrobiota bacterium]|nr:dephospho-CoA kinase [Verrucomicrobiota bacterium]
MPVIGITGGIATGKSTFVTLLRELLPAATFFDADAVGRELTEANEEARAEIAATFGSDIFTAEGHLNRAALRAIVFADADKKRALEQILHPRIRRQWAAEAERRRQSTELFFADIPLLYETGGETLCDRVVVVACSPEVQLERLMKRSALSSGAAQQIVRAQLPLGEKIARADHVIWNNGPRAVLAEQTGLLARLWQQPV